jgi:hypothetical protein
MVSWLIAGFSACSSVPVVPAPTATLNIMRESITPGQPLPTSTLLEPIGIPSPSGRIVFSAGPHPHADIYVINADGSGLTQLTTDPAADFDPSWSPDGNYLLFQADGLYMMRVDGSGVTKNRSNP